MVTVARCGAVLVVLGWISTTSQGQLTFNFINQGGASASMMTGLSEAAALWSSRLNDPITINIRVNAAALPASVIGHTEIFYDPYAYSAVRTALVNDRISADDISSTNALQAAPALSMLINRTANNPNGVVSPTPYFDTGLGGPGQAGTENNNTIRMPTANAKAMGLIPGNTAGLDGVITFTNQPIFDFNRSNGIQANQIDFVGVAAHEMGHLLGFVSGVDILAGNSAAPGLNDNQLRFVTPLDLHRYSTRSIGAGGGVGVIDWTADSTDKYFSVDGGITPLASFSTGSVYEESHWKFNQGIGIMSPTVNAGELLSISAMDVRAFDVIGYDPTPVPEPASVLAILCVSMRIRAAFRHRRTT